MGLYQSIEFQPKLIEKTAIGNR